MSGVTFTGKFKNGMKVGSETHTEFVVREMTTEDMLMAEMEAPATMPLNFTAALATQQLVRVGTHNGPFTLSMVRGLAPADFQILRAALGEVALLGEAQQSSSEST